MSSKIGIQSLKKTLTDLPMHVLRQAPYPNFRNLRPKSFCKFWKRIDTRCKGANQTSRPFRLDPLNQFETKPLQNVLEGLVRKQNVTEAQMGTLRFAMYDCLE